ncbi:hypothetical protein T492DRAFT_1151885 [Pavlovales sp. CCMP2436]|nr:hypothetical protein T492DRAFT_1151885 [Pavlovales sp. CCMP2436]
MTGFLLAALILVALTVASSAALLTHAKLSRRACLSAALLAPPAAHARERAQNAQSLFGVITWGGSERCDPTDAGCGQSGRQPSSVAAADICLPEPRDTVSTRVYLDLALNRKAAGRLSFGLYASTPESAATFARLCEGTLTTRPGEQAASYQSSSLLRIARGRYLVGGALTLAGGLTELGLGSARPVYTPVTPNQNTEVGLGSLSEAGLLAMRRGGRSVDWAITLGDARGLDGSWVVIGQLLDESSLALLRRLSEVPVNKYRSSPLMRTEVTAAGLLTARA